MSEPTTDIEHWTLDMGLSLKRLAMLLSDA